MTTRITLSEPLADLCERNCARCARECGNEAPPCSCPPAVDLAELSHSEIRKRWVNLPMPRCERCEFLLLMLAIEHLVAAEDQADWLKQPNVDLGGRRPEECIAAGAYEPVFTTLCLLDPLGPVS